MTARAPIAVGIVVAALTALGLGAGAAGFAADAQARVSAGSIVVNRDGAVRPGRTSTLTALCPRGYVAFTWGFRTIPNPNVRTNAILLGAEPLLKATGGVSGYTARFTNPNQVTTPVRLSVTCTRPIDMDLRLKVGKRDVRVRGRAAGGAAAAAKQPALALLLKQRRTEVEPGAFARVRQFCSGRAGPPRVPVSSSFTLGEARLAGNFPILKGRRVGWQAEFANPTARAQTVESRVVCAEGRGIAVSFAGAGRALTAARGPKLHVDARKTLRETVAEDRFFFSGTCEKGLFSQWAHRVINGGDPGRVPIMSDWAHIAAPSFHEAMSRMVGFDRLTPGVDLVLQPLCIKGRGIRMGQAELLLHLAR